MRILQYQPLGLRERAFLTRPGADEACDEWQNALAALTGVVSMLSESYPRPLYFEGGGEEWGAAEESLAGLRGTPVQAQVRANLAVARRIWEAWEREGHTPGLHQVADAFLDAVAVDSMSLRASLADPLRSLASPPTSPRRRLAGGG